MPSSHLLSTTFAILLVFLQLSSAISSPSLLRSIDDATPSRFWRRDDAEASAEYTKDDDFKKAVLNATNTYRGQHNATGLRWNESLAKTAQEWSEGCVFEHSVSLFSILCSFSLFSPFSPPLQQATNADIGMQRADQRARTSPQVTPMPRPPSSPGEKSATRTISKRAISRRRSGTLRRWCGRGRPRLGAGERAAMGRRRKREKGMQLLGGMLFASIGLLGMVSSIFPFGLGSGFLGLFLFADEVK